MIPTNLKEELVILVDEADNETGLAEKMKTHRQGWLHRAFSVFIFSEDGKMLLQQRAPDKYHCGGLWTNACCSHPFPGEAIEDAAVRRLKEEMGFQTEVEKVFDFVYRAELDNGLIEHEFDHVFVGKYDGEIPFNPTEVMNTRYLASGELEVLVAKEPELFTPWFKAALPRVLDWWRKQH